MNLNLGLRALLVLAFVLAATCAIVRPDLFGGAAQPDTEAASTLLALGRL